MSTKTKFEVEVEELENGGGEAWYEVTAASYSQAIGHAMVMAGMMGQGIGPCRCKVFPAGNRSLVLFESDVVGN